MSARKDDAFGAWQRYRKEADLAAAAQRAMVCDGVLTRFGATSRQASAVRAIAPYDEHEAKWVLALVRALDGGLPGLDAAQLVVASRICHAQIRGNSRLSYDDTEEPPYLVDADLGGEIGRVRRAAQLNDHPRIYSGIPAEMASRWWGHCSFREAVEGLCWYAICERLARPAVAKVISSGLVAEVSS